MRKGTVVIVLFAAVLIGTAGILVAGRSRDAADRATPSPVASEPSVARSAAPAADGVGHIEGPVVYPGEAVPGDIRVCAANLATSRETCTRRILSDGRFTSGRGYRLDVAPGNYQVYAVVPSFDPGYQAFYSAFVVCGYQATCSDHAPITVSVEAGRTRSGIEPGDFYE